MRLDLSVLLASLSIAAACGAPSVQTHNDGPGPEPGSDDWTAGPPTGGPEAGSVEILLTDAPLDDVDEVYVTFDSVQVQAKDAGGWVSVTSTVQTFELLSLQGGLTEPLGLTTLSTGTYGQIRLGLIDAWLVADGESHDLEIPSGDTSGLKLNHGFEIQGGVRTTITLDFDAAKSIHRTGNGRYIMRPVIEVVATSTAAEPASGEGATTGI